MTLPDTVTRQDRLLTVSTNASKFLEGLMDAGMTYISPPLPTYAR